MQIRENECDKINNNKKLNKLDGSWQVYDYDYYDTHFLPLLSFHFLNFNRDFSDKIQMNANDRSMTCWYDILHADIGFFTFIWIISYPYSHTRDRKKEQTDNVCGIASLLSVFMD